VSSSRDENETAGLPALRLIARAIGPGGTAARAAATAAAPPTATFMSSSKIKPTY